MGVHTIVEGGISREKNRGGQRRIYKVSAYHCRRWDIKGKEQGEDRGEYIMGVHTIVEGEISREKNRTERYSVGRKDTNII